MMSKDQENSVRLVYRNFLKKEYSRITWTKLDTTLYDLECIQDEQLIKECLVPQLIEAVNGICELYMETGELHDKNRYILQNYLAVSHLKIIYVQK